MLLDCFWLANGKMLGLRSSREDIGSPLGFLRVGFDVHLGDYQECHHWHHENIQIPEEYRETYMQLFIPIKFCTRYVIGQHIFTGIQSV